MFRCRVYLLPWRMPNSAQMHYTFCLAWLPHASFAFAFRCKPGFRWFTNGLRTGHTLVTFSNTAFLIFFSKLINLWPHPNLATLWIRQMNVIFNQSEGSNPLVSLKTLLWCFISWFFAHWECLVRVKGVVLLGVGIPWNWEIRKQKTWRQPHRKIKQWWEEK